MQKTILVLFGGRSPEHNVSIQSAQAVLSHMDPARWHPLIVGITKDGAWRLLEAPPAEDWQDAGTPCTMRLDYGRAAVLLLDGTERALHFDAAFPIFHGRLGEDGAVQGLLELAGIPVIGCGVLSSAVCMDKDAAHQLVSLSGMAVPRGQVIHAGDAPEKPYRAAAQLGYPLFVKPVGAGSSFGVSRVDEPDKLPRAVEMAFQYDETILLEEAIPGFEVGCAVLGNAKLTVGAVDEIELSSGFFNYEEKYTLRTSAIHCPARIPDYKAREIQEAAKVVYRALRCRGFARVDFFLTPEGKIVFNEVNTIPGFTAHSRYPTMMKTVGIGFTELLNRIIELGVDT